MITRRTKIQLAIFVVITLLGVTFVGAKYARLDRLLFDDTYTVVAHFPDSGGVFEGAEVTYRGTTIGRVGEMKLTAEGVDVILDIENGWDKIPADTLAIVANRSAVGEQFVDLQPLVDEGPYLKESSEIAQANTDIPISTSKLIGDLATTVGEWTATPCAPWSRSSVRLSRTPVRTSVRSSTRPPRSSRPPMPTSTSPPPSSGRATRC